MKGSFPGFRRSSWARPWRGRKNCLSSRRLTLWTGFMPWNQGCFAGSGLERVTIFAIAKENPLRT